MSYSISFDAGIAIKYGVPEAIFIQHLQYKIHHHKCHGTNFYEGKYWTYNTLKYLSEKLYPFWTIDQIRQIIKKLEIQGVILKKNFNHKKYDRTSWFSFVEEERFLRPLEIQTFLDDPTPLIPKCIVENPEMGKIPNGSGENPTSANQPLSEENNNENRRNSHVGKIPNGSGENPTPIPLDISLDNIEREVLDEKYCSTESVSVGNATSQNIKKENNKKGTRLAVTWKLPNKWREWAIGMWFMNDQINLMAIQFKNHWLAATKDNTKLDWERAWKKWCLNEAKFQGLKINLEEEALREISENKEPTEVVEVPNPILKSDDPIIQRWYDLQEELKHLVGEPTYKSWFDPSRFHYLGINSIGNHVFKAENRFCRDYINDYHLKEALIILLEAEDDDKIEIMS